MEEAQYRILEGRLQQIIDRIEVLEKNIEELKTEVADHENILRPVSLYLPHPTWDFDYHNTIDVLKGLLQKTCVMFQIDLDKGEKKEEEFNF